MISEAMQKVGNEGVITVEEAKGVAGSSWALGTSPTCPSITRLITSTSSRSGVRLSRTTWPWCTIASRPATRADRDLWSNPFIGRTASHPWGAMRFVAAVFGSGMMDRHPSLRVAILGLASVATVLGHSHGRPGRVHGLRR